MRKFLLPLVCLLAFAACRTSAQKSGAQLASASGAETYVNVFTDSAKTPVGKWKMDSWTFVVASSGDENDTQYRVFVGHPQIKEWQTLPVAEVIMGFSNTILQLKNGGVVDIPSSTMIGAQPSYKDGNKTITLRDLDPKTELGVNNFGEVFAKVVEWGVPLEQAENER
jgi:hypothetical protein